MIDLIKLIVQTLTQVIPQLRGIRGDQRRRELGATLFILYVRLNETALAGEGIIYGLEAYIRGMEHYHQKPATRGHLLKGEYWVSNQVRHQITNFERLDELIRESSVVLQIIDTESYNNLKFLLERKFGGLLQLSRIMRSGSLPLLPHSDDDLRTLIALGSDQRALAMAWHDIHDTDGNMIPMQSDWGDETCEQIASYLQERNPREQLTQIRASLSSLRKALEENFTLSDILLEVEDRRMGMEHWL